MEIVVCIKQVPDTTEVKLDKETGTLIRAGVPSIINPDDRSAIELALKIKDNNEGVTVSVLTMGPPQTKEILIESLCMGADKAYLLTDRAFAGADTWATSLTLAKAIEDSFKPDIIICGRQAIDGDTAQVGPQIAEHLKLPQVTYASDIVVDGNTVKVRRNFENGYQDVEMQMPCLLTALSEKTKPRYMKPALIVDIFENIDDCITTLTHENIDIPVDELGLKGSPTRVKRSMTKGSKTMGEIIKNDLDEGVAKAYKLIEKMSTM